MNNVFQINKCTLHLCKDTGTISLFINTMNNILTFGIEDIDRYKITQLLNKQYHNDRIIKLREPALNIKLVKIKECWSMQICTNSNIHVIEMLNNDGILLLQYLLTFY